MGVACLVARYLSRLMRTVLLIFLMMRMQVTVMTSLLDLETVGRLGWHFPRPFQFLIVPLVTVRLLRCTIRLKSIVTQTKITQTINSKCSVQNLRLRNKNDCIYARPWRHSSHYSSANSLVYQYRQCDRERCYLTNNRAYFRRPKSLLR